jgi:hypothetical protein
MAPSTFNVDNPGHLGATTWSLLQKAGRVVCMVFWRSWWPGHLGPIFVALFSWFNQLVDLGPWV